MAVTFGPCIFCLILDKPVCDNYHLESWNSAAQKVFSGLPEKKMRSHPRMNLTALLMSIMFVSWDIHWKNDKNEPNFFEKYVCTYIWTMVDLAQDQHMFFSKFYEAVPLPSVVWKKNSNLSHPPPLNWARPLMFSKQWALSRVPQSSPGAVQYKVPSFFQAPLWHFVYPMPTKPKQLQVYHTRDWTSTFWWT
jgi:hypothetical protein